MPGFTLDARLVEDTLPVGRLDLCEVRLMDDTRFCWILLVPRRAGLAELYELTRAERGVLMEEITSASETLSRFAKADKINVAALGNQVRQLHVHLIARHEGDDAWPGPVWGAGARKPYSSDEGRIKAAAFARALNLAENANTL